MEQNNWFSNTVRYLYAFINICSLCHTLKMTKSGKFIIVFSVNLCFLMLSFWGFLILLFLICFFRHFIIPISIDYQYITSNQ